MKSKTKNDPWKPAQPYILKGMQQTSDVFDANQGNLQDMSTKAYDAFKSISPQAFQASPFVQSAQSTAQAIGGGALLGTNPGQATYQRLQNPGGPMAKANPHTGSLFGGGRPAASNDPSMELLQGMATDRSVGAGRNPGDRFASATAQGQYLNQQPSAGLYGEMMDRSYSTSNPFIDDIIRQNDENVRTQANRMFSSRGMGTGIGSAFADVLSKNLADTGGQIRYQNYGDAENRRLAAAGQSDAAFSSERGRMMDATGLLSNNFNAAQDRALQANAQRLSAAQSLGGQFNQGENRALEAARAADASEQSQVQQMLTALGLAPDLRNAEFAGINPALNLLNAAADIPYVGTAALNGQIRQASGGYGTTTQSGGLGSKLLGAGAQLGSAHLMRGR